MPVYSRFHFGATSSRFTRRSGSLNGRGRRNRPLKTLKITTLPAMRKASVNTASAEKHGFFSSRRKAKRRLFILPMAIPSFFHPPVAQPDDAVAVGSVGFRMCDLDDRHAFRVQLLEQLHDLPALIRVQVAGRLVGQ